MPTLFIRHGIKAVLFDFDGTLSHTVLDFSLMRKRAGEAVANCTSLSFRTDLPLMEALTELCAMLDVETALSVRNAAMRAVVEVELEAADRARLFPFVVPMLESLRAHGVAVAVITRNCSEAVFRVFSALPRYAACILTRDDVANVKPHPEHIQTALVRMGCKPRQSLMVGDHPMDIEAGKRAGVFTAAVASGNSPAESLEAAGPDWQARDAGELMRRFGLVF